MKYLHIAYYYAIFADPNEKNIKSYKFQTNENRCNGRKRETSVLCNTD